MTRYRLIGVVPIVLGLAVSPTLAQDKPKTLSFKYDSSVEIVTKEGQKLALASSGTMDLRRPDKIRATRSGSFADVELVHDGKTVSVFGKSAKIYGQAEEAGTIDQLVDTIRTTSRCPLPTCSSPMSTMR